MMSAPLARTSSGRIALTVAAVPTGMNAGVRMSPRCIVIVPVRAGPSVAAMVKAKRVTPPPNRSPRAKSRQPGHTPFVNGRVTSLIKAILIRLAESPPELGEDRSDGDCGEEGSAGAQSRGQARAHAGHGLRARRRLHRLDSRHFGIRSPGNVGIAAAGGLRRDRQTRRVVRRR